MKPHIISRITTCRVSLLFMSGVGNFLGLRQYGSKLNFLHRFQQYYPGVQVLPTPSLTAPPVSTSITLAWAELSYSLKTSPYPTRDTVSFGATRQLRSALGWQSTLVSLLSHPESNTFDKHGQLWETKASPHRAAVLSQFTKGMEGRIGTDATPSWALRDRHIRYFDKCVD